MKKKSVSTFNKLLEKIYDQCWCGLPGDECFPQHILPLAVDYFYQKQQPKSAFGPDNMMRDEVRRTR